MATIIDIGRKYQKTTAEVQEALAAIKFGKNIAVATKIESSVEQQLDAHWRRQSAASKNKQQAEPKRQRTRTIGQTQVSERPRRVIKNPFATKPPRTATTAPATPAVAKPQPPQTPPPIVVKPQPKPQPPIIAAEVTGAHMSHHSNQTAGAALFPLHRLVPNRVPNRHRAHQPVYARAIPQ